MDSSVSKATFNKKKIRAKSLFNKKDYINASKLYTELCSEYSDAECHYMLGLTYMYSTNYASAEQHLFQALQIDPTFQQAWNQLGITQATQRKFDNAITSFKKSLEIKPRNTKALNNLGNLYREIGHLTEAENCYKQSLKLDSKNFITINNIANIFLTRCEYDRAEKYYLKAIKLNKDYFDAFYNLGATYQSKGDNKLAIKYYKRAQKIRPNDFQAQVAIANSYEKQGKHDIALELIDPLLSKNILTPDIADIYSKICIKNKEYDKGINLVTKCLTIPVNPIHEQALHFSLGDLYDKNKLYDEAYKQYLQANTMRPYQYNKQHYEAAFTNIINIFKGESQKRNISLNQSNTPVFIVGMPRSGTTLIEQILSSHSEVCGAGELPYLGEIAEQAISDNKSIRYPECINHLSAGNLTQLSDDYLAKLNSHGDGRKHISDKMPHNFMYVGLIRKLFPNCKIIHCLRNPLDVCLSIYFHNFNQNHPYTDKLSHLGHYYNQYRKLMAFWKCQYDDLIIDISYEELLTDAEHNVRKILDHVGLEWQDNCLKYYENKRTVSTPSYAQVKQPLYTASMERWRNYTSHIDELKAAVGDEYL